ncbi:hypothetical protein AB0368_37945, partial [Actinoplanes sp. NPDC051475]
GLPQPLRAVVGLALAKDPRDRPSARELLDMLLGDRPAPRPVAARQQTTVLTESRDDLLRAVTADPHYDDYEPPPDRAVRTRGHRMLAALAVLLVIAGLTTVGLVVNAHARSRTPTAGTSSPDGGEAAGAPEPGPGGTGSPATDDPLPSAPPDDPEPPSTGGRPVPIEPTGGEPIIQDPLNQPGQWFDSEIREANARCFIRGVMKAERIDRGVYQCAGPDEKIEDDFGVEVTTTLQTAGSCAAIWFHWSDQDGGQVLRICQDEIDLAADTPADRQVFDSVQLDDPIPLQKTTRIHLVVRDGAAQVFRGGTFAGEFALPARVADAGEVRLGLSAEATDTEPPYAVTFSNVDIRSI